MCKIVVIPGNHEFVTKVSSRSKCQYIHANGNTLQIDDLLDTWDTMERI